MSKQTRVSNLLRSTSLITLLTPAVAMISSVPVSAQTDEAAASQANTSGVIIVTARGREESVIEVPVAISVLSQDELNAAGVTDIQGVSDYTPGFRFQNSDGQAGGRSSAALQFRGVSPQVSSAANRTGAIFYDGSYISQGAGFIPMIDLERVEVIKGPQNAVFARNTFSGAVNFVPKEPGDVLEVSAQAEVGFGLGDGEQTSARGVLAIGGPITDDIGFRVATTYERKGADYEYLDGTPNGQEDNFAIFGTLVFNPADTLKIKATGYFVDSKDTSNAQSVNATVAPGDCNKTFSGNLVDPVTGVLTPFSTDLSLSADNLFCGGAIPDASNFNASSPVLGFGGFDPDILADIAPFTSKFPDGLGNAYGAWRVNLSFDLEIGDHTLTGLASQGEAELGGLQDAFFGEDGTLGVPSASQFRTPIGNWTQDTFFETRIASSPDKRLRYALGASYYKQKFRNGNGTALQGNINFQDNEAVGIFGSVDFDITDALTLSAEGRWVDDKQTIVYDGAHGLADPLAVTNDSLSYNDFMPRVILSYSPNPDLNIYASWSQSSLNGIATGAVRYTATTGIPTPGVGNFTDIQNLTSYEVGVKQQIGDWLNFSIAAYYMDWENQPFSSTTLVASAFGFTSVFLNATGDSEYKGIDFEFNLTPTDGLELFGSVGWVDAKVNNFGQSGSVATSVLCPTRTSDTFGPLCPITAGGGTISADGNTPRNVAEWSGAVGASYTFPVGDNEYYVRGDGLFTGKRFVDNFEYNYLKASWKVNARVGGNIGENLGLEFFVENLFNNDQFTSGGTTGISFFSFANNARKFFGTLPEKREVGMRLMLDF